MRSLRVVCLSAVLASGALHAAGWMQWGAGPRHEGSSDATGDALAATLAEIQYDPFAAADWVLILPLVLCLMGAAGALMLRRSNRTAFMLALLIVLGVIACEIALLLRVVESGPLAMTMGKWLPPFGISFAADIFGAAFALTAALVTLVVLIYAEGDRAGRDASDGFHALVLLLLAGVTGSFLTGDLFNLYVWFEVMLIASFGTPCSASSRLMTCAICAASLPRAVRPVPMAHTGS